MPRESIDTSTSPARCAQGAPIDRRRWLASLLASGSGLFATLLGGGTLGCAAWKKEASTAQKPAADRPMHTYKMAPDSVVVEIAVVDAPADPDVMERIWLSLDETAIAPESRRLLAINGFRVGVAPGNLPAELAGLLAEQHRLEDVDAETGALAPGARSPQQRHQLRTGQAVQLAAVPIQPTVTWLLEEDGYRSGGAFDDAECQIALRGYPRRDGTVRLRLIPEIHYGEARQSVDVANNSMILRPFRQKRVFQELETVIDLRPGQVVVLGSSGGDGRLGHQFLAQPTATEERRRRLILVRPVQTQLDDLFAREQRFLPLETPLE
ncbi:MAG TPA: hypothetical protein PLI18_14055 [Pirellulaceae bacterium]|nr:hypothetical protein [Pirellulaceae bacterium]